MIQTPNKIEWDNNGLSGVFMNSDTKHHREIIDFSMRGRGQK